MTRTVQTWVDQARYDQETAEAMFASKRYLYVLFCCQQAVEKLLKAIIVDRTGEFPPRIHNLPRLVEAAGIEIDEERIDFLAMLSAYYIQTRYPEEMVAIASTVTRSIADENLCKTKEITKWLISMLK